MKKIITIAAIFALLLTATGIIAKFRIRQERSRRAELAKNRKAPEVTITILEGWTLQEVANYLEKQGITAATSFLEAEKNFDASAYEFLKTKPAGQGLEGFLFPDTYRILKPTALSTATEAQIIKKMLDNFDIKLSPDLRRDIQSSGRSLFEIITLASIIEKETGRFASTPESRQRLETERKMVAGVFFNRLNAGMPLQSDATVNFITKKNVAAASAEDIQVNSPYNTYKYKGLPPGPISNPSLSSITAAIYPAATDYFYFLHKQPSGDIVFSRTFEEHVQNKIKYLKSP